jgi:hypothetical protein
MSRQQWLDQREGSVISLPITCYNTAMNTVLHRLQNATTGSRFTRLLLRNAYLRTALWCVLLLVAIVLSSFAYAYQSSPAAIRNPQFEHLHFRMQIIVDGKAVNFADKKFQEGYSKDNCNADLTMHPIHFHDNKDQFVHVHWRNLTGGQVLKYYGWNYIGGVDGMLGYQFKSFPNLQTVPIHGMSLPKVPQGAQMYVYSGDEQHFTKRNFSDFTDQQLEKFFGAQSNVPRDETSLLDAFFPKASAHAGHEHNTTISSTTTTDPPSQESLQRINNLLGNVVIFSQKDKPTDQQVKDRFNNLAPLSESSCAG